MSCPLIKKKKENKKKEKNFPFLIRLPEHQSAQLHSCHPTFHHPHWLPIDARICFKALVLAFQAAKGTLHSIYKSCSLHPSTPLDHSSLPASSGRLVVP